MNSSFSISAREARPPLRRLARALAFGFGLHAPAAWAQAAETPAKALFVEGRELAAAGNFTEACPKFQQSLALEVGVGTQFHLADCWERIGRLASAQALFLGAAASAKAAGQIEREQVLRERAAALEPRISRLVVSVADPAAGLMVLRDSLPLERATWGSAIGVDAGSYLVEARAPGRKPWSERVLINAGTSTVRVEVPVLELEAPRPASAAVVPKPVPAIAAPPAIVPAGTPNDRAAKGSAYPALIAAGVGAGGLIVGGVMGLRYLSANSDAKAICPQGLGCSRQDIDEHARLVDQAGTALSYTYVGLTVGAIGLTTAAILYLSGSSRPEQSASKLHFEASWLHGGGQAQVRGAF